MMRTFNPLEYKVGPNSIDLSKCNDSDALKRWVAFLRPANQHSYNMQHVETTNGWLDISNIGNELGLFKERVDREMEDVRVAIKPAPKRCKPISVGRDNRPSPSHSPTRSLSPGGSPRSESPTAFRSASPGGFVSRPVSPDVASMPGSPGGASRSIFSASASAGGNASRSVSAGAARS